LPNGRLRGTAGIVIGASATGALVGALVTLAASNLLSEHPAVAQDGTQAAAKMEPAGQPAKAEPEVLAAAGDRSNTIDCEQQTWPHVSQACIEAKKRSVRVVSTDKLPESQAEPVAQTRPVAVAAVASPSPSSAPSSSGARETTGSGASAGGVSEPAAHPPKRAEKKAKTRKSAKRRAREREIDTDFEDTRGRQPAFGRWFEREYDVPSDDGRGRRRVIIIDRSVERFDNPWRF
jgi:hypothetical protein